MIRLKRAGESGPCAGSARPGPGISIRAARARTFIVILLTKGSTFSVAVPTCHLRGPSRSTPPACAGPSNLAQGNAQACGTSRVELPPARPPATEESGDIQRSGHRQVAADVEIHPEAGGWRQAGGRQDTHSLFRIAGQPSAVASVAGRQSNALRWPECQPT